MHSQHLVPDIEGIVRRRGFAIHDGLHSRSEAIDRMVEQARGVGANAVINIRFSTSNIAAGAAEVMAYGTAVVVS